MSKNPKLYTSEKTGESKSLREWGNSTGIDPATLSYRILKLGMSIDEAIAYSFNKKTVKNLITDPITGETHSIKEWSEITGVSANTIYNRAFVYKWPIEKVLYGEKHEVINKSPKLRESRKHIDLTGMKFGKLTVLRRADKDYVYISNGREHREWKWHCRCDCGNEVDVVQHNLTSGAAASCGCSSIVDMVGKQFGRLRVVRRAPDRMYGNERVIYWYCMCNCGNPNLVSVSGKNLRSGGVTSCGCKIGKPAATGIYDENYHNNPTYGYSINQCYNGVNFTPAIMYTDTYNDLYTQEDWEAMFPDQFK